MDWLTIAERLPLGHKTRITCECGDGKTLVINHRVQGYSCYCFRCDLKEFEGKGMQSIAELNRIKALNETAATVSIKIELPIDFTSEIPLLGRLWLYNAGLTPSDWKQYNIGYSPKMERVVLPVYAYRELVWCQYRAIHKGQKPKYLQPSTGKESIVFRGGDQQDKQERVVVVEDILSAMKVGKIIPTRSLLGTKITTQQAVILSDAARVTVWLDPDKAGRDGSRTIKKTLCLLTEVDSVVTDTDPKDLSLTEIKKVLNA